MAYKVPVSDLMASLQKAGVPMSGSDAMTAATPGLGQKLTDQAYGEDTQLGQIKSNFMKQLDQVAQMDQKLGAAYSDPTSPLYTDNVYAREKIISGAHSTSSQGIKFLAGKYKDRQNELDQKVEETLSYFKQLTTLAAKEEARAEKLAKEKYAMSQGKGKYIKDEKGNDVFVRTYKGAKSVEQQLRDSIEKKKMLREQAAALVGLKDEDAVTQYEHSPEDYQTYLLDLVLNGKITPPPSGFTADDINQGARDYNRKFGLTDTAEEKQAKKLDQLKKVLGAQ